jgi:hypothetical protein
MTSRNDTEGHMPRSLAGIASHAPSQAAAASRLLVPLLAAEGAAFAGLVLSGKIPEFLVTALRALLTF